jgi:hypothetical protein
MRTSILDLTTKTVLASMLSLVAGVTAQENALNPVEKKTVSIVNSISNNGNLKVSIQNAQNLHKDTQYMGSHQRETVIAKINDEQADSVVNTMSKQFFRAFFGVYEQEVKTKLLTLDLSDDEVTESNITVSSYDRRNFELTMRARKNKERLALEGGEALADNSEKGKWKVRPRVGNPGVHVGYLAAHYNIEMRLTTAEQVINLHRNLRDLAVDVFYNVDIKNNESSLTLSKPVANNLRLQVQSIGRGVNALEQSDERISLNFGQIF